MKITVDVHKAEQVYDLDTGVQKNLIVFELGGTEHRIEVSEEELEAILMDTVSRARIHYSDEEKGLESHLHLNDNNDQFTYDPAKISDIQFGEDVIQMSEGAVQIEVPEGSPSIRLQGYDGAQDYSGIFETGQEVPEEQTQPNQRQVEKTPREHRNESIQEKREQDPAVQRKKLAKNLRERARKAPRRRLSPDQVDEAGNPIVRSAQPAPENQQSGPEVGYNDAGVPTVAGVEDDDGFPSA